MTEPDLLNFPPELDALAMKLFPSTDPFDAPGVFNVVPLLNARFPDLGSLDYLEIYSNELKQRLVVVDDEIHRAVRVHARSAAESRAELAAARNAVTELTERLHAIRQRAGETEKAVKNVSKDVMMLDIAKRNITLTISTLKRLVMLVNACEQLTELASEREYSKTAGLVSAVAELEISFEPMKSLNRIEELLKHKNRIFGDLRQQLIEDFSNRIGAPPPPDAPRVDLAGAAETAEALGESVKKELIRSYFAKIFAEYNLNFAPSETGQFAPLDYAERRFQWLSRMLREHTEKAGLVFPEHWFIPASICAEFCRVSRGHFEFLVKSKAPEPALLIQVMSKCVELENDMQRRFEKLFREVSQRYLAKVGVVSEEKQQTLECPKFRGMMSDCLEPFLGQWVKSEERSLLDYIQTVKQAGLSADDIIGSDVHGAANSGTARSQASSGGSTADQPEATEPRMVFTSSVEIFTRMKSLVSRCRAASTGQSLADLSVVFKKMVSAYSDHVLKFRLPNSRNLDENNLETVCAVLGSCEYCKTTAPLLESGVLRVIDGNFKNSVNLKAEVGKLNDLSVDALAMAVACVLGSEVSLGFSSMVSLDWFNLEIEGVAGVSPVIPRMNAYLARCMRTLVSSLALPEFIKSCEMLAVRLITQINETLSKLRPISQGGAQQLIVDFNNLKQHMIDLPVSSAGFKGSVVQYSSTLTKGFSKIDVLLKALASPAASDPDSLREMLKSLDPSLSGEDDLEREARRVEFLGAAEERHVRASLSFRGFAETTNSLRASNQAPSMGEISRLFEPAPPPPPAEAPAAVGRISTFKGLANSFKKSLFPAA